MKKNKFYKNYIDKNLMMMMMIIKRKELIKFTNNQKIMIKMILSLKIWMNKKMKYNNKIIIIQMKKN